MEILFWTDLYCLNTSHHVFIYFPISLKSKSQTPLQYVSSTPTLTSHSPLLIVIQRDISPCYSSNIHTLTYFLASALAALGSPSPIHLFSSFFHFLQVFPQMVTSHEAYPDQRKTEIPPTSILDLPCLIFVNSTYYRLTYYGISLLIIPIFLIPLEYKLYEGMNFYLLCSLIEP